MVNDPAGSETMLTPDLVTTTVGTGTLPPPTPRALEPLSLHPASAKARPITVITQAVRTTALLPAGPGRPEPFRLLVARAVGSQLRDLGGRRLLQIDIAGVIRRGRIEVPSASIDADDLTGRAEG